MPDHDPQWDTRASEGLLVAEQPLPLILERKRPRHDGDAAMPHRDQMFDAHFRGGNIFHRNRIHGQPVGNPVEATSLMPADMIREIWASGVGPAATTNRMPSTRCERNSERSSFWRAPLSSELTAMRE